MDNVNNTLLADLHSYLIPPDPQFNNKQDMIMFNFKVTEVRGCGELEMAAQVAHCLGS